MKRTVVGADEAGRGPVLGSMFVAGVLVDEEDLEKLESMGLKDSKKLSDRKRKSLGPKIEDMVEDFYVREITANDIDELRKIMSLNDVELKAFAKVLANLEPDRAIIDLPEPDGERFAKKIKNELDNQEIDITAEHEADDNYPIVSAASILAKNAREEHVAELKDKYGVDFKSGYPHDKPTIQFLEKYLERNGELPEETRMSWSTAKRIVRESQQGSLDNF